MHGKQKDGGVYYQLDIKFTRFTSMHGKEKDGGVYYQLDVLQDLQVCMVKRKMGVFIIN